MFYRLALSVLTVPSAYDTIFYEFMDRDPVGAYILYRGVVYSTLKLSY